MYCINSLEGLYKACQEIGLKSRMCIFFIPNWLFKFPDGKLLSDKCYQQSLFSGIDGHGDYFCFLPASLWKEWNSVSGFVFLHGRVLNVIEVSDYKTVTCQVVHFLRWQTVREVGIFPSFVIVLYLHGLEGCVGGGWGVAALVWCICQILYTILLLADIHSVLSK